MAVDKDPDRERAPVDPTPRRPYHKPKLADYGTVRDITTHVGNVSPIADAPPHFGKFRTR